MTESVVIGIDLGGTQVRAGAVNAQAHLLAYNEAPIEAQRGPAAGIERIAALIEKTQLDSGASLLGIGVGCTGPVDSLRGLVQNPYTLPTWENVPLAEELKRLFHTQVTLENDADVAALGEYWTGAGQNARRLYAVTVGTGIGTACIIDGHIYRGVDGAHPDGGHHIIESSGALCYCGAHGCWESLASGPAIARLARAGLADFPSSRLVQMCGGDVTRIDARMVAEAQRLGDGLAKRVMQHAVEYFCLGLVNVITLFVPEVIVLSGGVMKSVDLYMPSIQRAVEQHAVMVPALKVKILPAKLGYQAGIFGAAYTIFQSL